MKQAVLLQHHKCSVFADVPPSAPQGEAALLALVCSGSVCGCHDIGRSQWRCSSAGAEPIPDWAPVRRERPHLIHDHIQRVRLQKPDSAFLT